MMKNKKRPSLFYILPQILLDIFCVYFSYYITLVIRISDKSEPYWSRITYMQAFHTIIPWSLLVCVIIFALFRFYRIMWQFASVDELMRNGQIYTKNFLKHGDLQTGGTLTFGMSSRPNKSRGTKATDRPYSFSREQKAGKMLAD